MQERFYSLIENKFNYRHAQCEALTAMNEQIHNIGLVCINNKNTNNHQIIKYKNIQQQNCNNINTYFDEIHAMIDQHRQNILRTYKQKSEQQFHELKCNKSFDNTNNIEIQFIASINEELDTLFKGCFTMTIANCNKKNISQTPKIKVTETKNGNLKILILDKSNNNNKRGDDIYTVLMNDGIHEFKTDNILICDTKPLTEYSICMKRNNSIYSKPQKIKTSFNCFWSRKYHGKNYKFDDDGFIHCRYKNGHCTVIGDTKYVFKSIQFKKIKFVFLMRELAQHLYFGFIEYNENVVNIINFNSVIKNNTNSYCLGCSKGSNEIKRYVKGKLKDKCKLYSPSKGYNFIFKNNAKIINNGNKFIFVVDFEKRVLNVYVNEEIPMNKIANNLNDNTFENIPHNILPFYSHSHNQYVEADSDVLLYITSDYTVFE
eukprot:442072_1